MTRTSRHVAAFATAENAFESELGSIRQLTGASFPLLERMSIMRLVLAAGAIREPLWNVTPTSAPLDGRSDPRDPVRTRRHPVPTARMGG